MSPFASHSRVFAVLPAGGLLSGARANGDNGTDPTPASGSWTVDYTASGPHTPPYHNEWDLASENYYDGTDEMVIPADGIYLVVAETNEGYLGNATTGYFKVVLTKNGNAVASYAQSYQNAVSFGYIDMPTVRWVGATEAGDRFALVAYNQTNADIEFGWYLNFLCVLRIA